MLGMSFFSPSKVAKPSRSSFRPHVDELETRLCPDGTLLTLTAQVLPGHLVQLSGTVTGDQVAGVTVVFTGAASGTTTTDQNGAYAFTTESASVGSVTAQIQAAASPPSLGGDGPMMPTASFGPAISSISTSDPVPVTAQAVIDEPAPVLTMAISYGAQNSVTLTGTLTDVDAAGETIALTGVAAGSVVTDSNGNFSLTTNASALGAIDATTTDLWSKTSNTAEVVVASDAPEIATFGAAHQAGNLWYFSGTVTAASPGGMTITFGGLNGALDGQTTIVKDDGTFAVSFFLPQGASGTVTAITTDWWGQVSDEAWVAVA